MTKDKLRNYARRYLETKEMVNIGNTSLKEIGGILLKEFTDAGIVKYEVEDCSITLVKGRKTTKVDLDKFKECLLLNGVPADVIIKAENFSSSTTTGSAYLKCNFPKQL